MASDFHTHTCHPGKTELVNDGKGKAPFWSLSFHPWQTAAMPENIEEDLLNCSALGEIGFDKFRGALPYPEGQLALFRRFLLLADEYKKGVVLHAVGSFEYLFECAREFPQVRFLVHGFAKHNPQLLESLLKQGFYVSLHPALINDEKLRTFLRSTPGARVGLETDDNAALDIDELYEQINIPGFEKAADVHFREFLQI